MQDNNYEQHVNENCLECLECPGCHSPGPFDIVVECWMRVSDEGTDSESASDVEWHNDSPCRCPLCGYFGKVENLKIAWDKSNIIDWDDDDDDDDDDDNNNKDNYDKL